MKIIHTSDYLTLELDVNKPILMATWKEETSEMSKEKFMNEGAVIIQNALKNKVSNIIGNNTNFRFAITPDMQEKMSKNSLAKINNSSIKKFAHIASAEVIAQLSVEQLFEENSKKTYLDKYFDNVDDAIKWCSE